MAATSWVSHGQCDDYDCGGVNNNHQNMDTDQQHHHQHNGSNLLSTIEDIMSEASHFDIFTWDNDVKKIAVRTIRSAMPLQKTDDVRTEDEFVTVENIIGDTHTGKRISIILALQLFIKSIEIDHPKVIEIQKKHYHNHCNSILDGTYTENDQTDQQNKLLLMHGLEKANAAHFQALIEKTSSDKGIKASTEWQNVMRTLMKFGFEPISEILKNCSAAHTLIYSVLASLLKTLRLKITERWSRDVLSNRFVGNEMALCAAIETCQKVAMLISDAKTITENCPPLHSRQLWRSDDLENISNLIEPPPPSLSHKNKTKKRVKIKQTFEEEKKCWYCANEGHGQSPIVGNFLSRINRVYNESAACTFRRYLSESIDYENLRNAIEKNSIGGGLFVPTGRGGFSDLTGSSDNTTTAAAQKKRHGGVRKIKNVTEDSIKNFDVVVKQTREKLLLDRTIKEIFSGDPTKNTPAAVPPAASNIFSQATEEEEEEVMFRPTTDKSSLIAATGSRQPSPSFNPAVTSREKGGLPNTVDVMAAVTIKDISQTPPPLPSPSPPPPPPSSNNTPTSCDTGGDVGYTVATRETEKKTSVVPPTSSSSAVATASTPTPTKKTLENSLAPPLHSAPTNSAFFAHAGVSPSVEWVTKRDLDNARLISNYISRGDQGINTNKRGTNGKKIDLTLCGE